MHQYDLTALRSLLSLSGQNRIQEWHIEVYLDLQPCCMQYSNDRKHVWRFVGDRTSLACFWYRYRVLSQGAMVWATSGNTTRTSLVQIDGNFNANRYISGILRQVVVHYFRDFQNVIIRQDNARLNVARRVLTFFDFYLGLDVVKICHLLKTYGHRLLRGWPNLNGQ